MTRDQQHFDDELAAWLERQDPPRSTDAVVDAVITRVSRTNQGTRTPMLFTAAAMAATFVVAVIVGTGLITQIRIDRGIGPSTPPAVREDGRRLPVNAVAIPFPEDRSLSLIFPGPGGTWVQVESDTYPPVWGAARIDAATNEVTATIPHGWGMAWRDDELWAMVDVAGTTPCCGPLPLSQIDPTTGAVLRTFDDIRGYDLAIDGNEAWITTEELKLMRVDLGSGELVATIQLPPVKPRWEDNWATFPMVAGGSIWVGVNDEDAYGPGSIVRIDPATNGVSATVPTAGRVESLANAFGSVWAVVQEEGDILRIDPVTATIIATISESDAVWGALVAGDDSLWTAVAGGVAPIDPSTNTIGEAVPVPWSFYWGMSIADGELWLTSENVEVIHLTLPTD